jgi:adenosylcobyric acid synthase
LAEAIVARAAAGKPLLGICGGYQMLCRELFDPIESGRGTVSGLGLIDGRVEFGAHKMLVLPVGSWNAHQVQGYAIHHGVVHATGHSFLDGVREGPVWGTMWHGAFENDAFRRAWLTGIGADAGSPWRAELRTPGFAQRREAMLDRIADAVASHVALDDLLALTGQDQKAGER